jgi:hypothetical protein
MALSVVEGHKEGAVTDFIDTPGKTSQTQLVDFPSIKE